MDTKNKKNSKEEAVSKASQMILVDRLMRAVRGDWRDLQSAMWVTDCGMAVRTADVMSFCGWLNSLKGNKWEDVHGMPIENWDDIHEFFSLIEGAPDCWLFWTGYNVVHFLAQRIDDRFDPRETNPEMLKHFWELHWEEVEGIVWC